MSKPPKKVATKAPKMPANVCVATVKWYGDNGKPFGFLVREEGGDIYLGRSTVEKAQEAGLLGIPQEGDTLQVIFDDDNRGVFAAEILAYTPVPEVCGHVLRLTKDGHAILKLDESHDEALVFARIAKAAALEAGEEVMAVLLRDERGIKAMRVRKTGRTVDLAPRKPAASQPKAEPPKKAMKHNRGDKKPKADATPQPLLRGVYGIVKSFNKNKGFGFITLEVDARTDTIGPDVFVSYREVERTENLPEQTLYVDDMLQFDVFPGREAGKVEAKNLRYVAEEEQMKEDAAPKVSAPPRKVPIHEALTGTVDWKEEDGKPNRYGFIVMKEPVPGLKSDTFLHISDVEAAGYQPMSLNGAKVTFDIVAAKKPGEYQAANLRDVVMPEPAAMGDLFDHLRDAALAAE